MVQLKIKTIGPVAIHSGEKIYLETDYLKKDDVWTRINVEKKKKNLTEPQLTYLGDRQITQEILDTLSIKPEEVYDITLEMLLKTGENKKKTEIQTINRTNGEAYLPGSSLKGELRANYEWSKQSRKADGNELFRNLKISDSIPTKNNTSIIKIKVTTPKTMNETEPKLSIYSEIINPQTEFNARSFGCKTLLQKCLEASNKRNEWVIKSEKSFFESIGENSQTEKEVIRFYEEMINNFNENTYIIRLGSGSSHTNMYCKYREKITEGIEKKVRRREELPEEFKEDFKERGRIKPTLNSRKIAEYQNNQYPMGWCTVKIENENN